MVDGYKVSGAKLAGVFGAVVGFGWIAGLSGVAVGAGVGAAYYVMNKRRRTATDKRDGANGA
jgi:hypothetical protein